MKAVPASFRSLPRKHTRCEERLIRSKCSGLRIATVARYLRSSGWRHDALVDILLEFLIQLLVQVVVELIGDFLLETAFHGVADVLRSRLGRLAIAVLVGFGFGLAWGDHLSSHASWPKLLWVSLGLAAAALIAAVARAAHPADSSPAEGSALHQALTPPWRWRTDRLVGFMVLNLAIAGGIAVGFQPAA